MKKLAKIYILSIFWSIFLMFSASNACFAALTISATPVQGSVDLRFGRIDVLNEENKEIRIRVTSTDSKQFQVYQRLVEPLSSQYGSSAARNALRYYALVGSNSQGTLYGQVPEYIGLSDHLIYSSTADGADDSFTLVYSIDKEGLSQSGQYVGRLQLTVRPLGGADKIAYVNVFIDAEFDLKFTVEGLDNRKEIDLVTTDEDRLEDGLNVEISGNSGSASVHQEIIDNFRSETTGKLLPMEAIEFSVDAFSGAGVQTKYAEFSPVPEGRREIFRSSDRDAGFRVIYRFNETMREQLEFGNYTGRILLSASNGASVSEQFIDVRISVERLFALDLEFEQAGMQFDDLLPMSPPQVHTVTVKVKSNVARPYAVNQAVMSPLANAKGDVLGEDYFLIKTEMLDDSKGKSDFSDYRTISRKHQALFISDAQGSPATFRVYYKILPYADMKAGSYKAEIAYSLEEL